MIAGELRVEGEPVFKVFATTPQDMGPGAIAAHAVRAETMGFDGLQVPDALHDGLLLAALALQATTRLTVGTGVLVAFPRSPMTVAVAAWDLQQLSDGRFELGLGTQIRQNIEERYSARWGAPVAQLREYVQSLKTIFHAFQTGDRLCFEGGHYRFTRLQPFFNPGPIDDPDIPVLCGAVGPAMTTMVGRVADGLIAHPTASAPEAVRRLCLPRLRAGFEAGKRDGEDFRLMLSPLIATGRDREAVAAQREKQRELLGFLFSTPAYWATLELFGWQHTGRQLQQLTRDGRWSEMAAAISDEMLDTLVPSGSYGEIAEVLERRYVGLASRITFPLPDDPADDTLAARAIERLRGSGR